MNGEDLELLKQFAHEQSQDAFAELVRRHVNFVYSATLRQVRSPQLAEEITQSVFADLARDASKLKPDTILTAWLYAVTRRTTIDVIRKESRRQLREQIAVEMNAMNSPDANWTQIEPLLDEAVAALDETDRDAVLLRFFENKSLREVGQQLGVSDDAAQKRVNRAVEKLRDFFTKRKITVGAGGLTILISANAVQSAPVGLAATISTAALAGTAVSTSTTIAATKIIAMTTLQKTFVTVTIVALAGAGIFETRQAAQLRQRNQTLLDSQIQQLQRENGDAARQLELAKNKPAPHLPAPPLQSSVAAPPTDTLQSSNLIQFLNGEHPQLTGDQIDAYLKANRHSAGSLLAVFRATGDKSFLKEAEEKFPNDPRVDFAAVFKTDSAAERRQWLDNFKQSAPDNAMASYLSALDYFKSGQTDQALKDLMAVPNQAEFQDYSWDFVQNANEAWSAAGYPEAETSMIATWDLALPQLGELKQLNQNLMDLAKSYRQAGDDASAQSVLQMGLTLGQQMSASPAVPLINQLVGIEVQRLALGAMDPNSSFGTSGSTVQDQLDQLAQAKTTIHDLVNQTAQFRQAMSSADWINYNQRTRAFGEVNAMQWLIAKYGQP